MTHVKRDYSMLLQDADALEAMGILKEWHSKSKDNKKLKDLTRAVLGLIGYISSLHLQRMGFDHVTDQQNDQILKLLQENENLKAEIKRLEENIEFLEELQR